jgi:hypothetical protein
MYTTSMRTTWLKLLLAILVILFVFLYKNYVSPNIGYKLPQPEYIVENVTACIMQDVQMIPVDTFGPSQSQFICGDLETDTEPLRLGLIIYQADNTIGWGSMYSAARHIQNGSFVFTISPRLPPGNYRALLQHARDSAAQIYFTVSE